jgi:hypothetical protein
MTTADVVSVTSDSVVGTWQDVVIGISRRTPTFQTVEALRRATTNVFERSFTSVVYLLVVEPTSAPPGQELVKGLFQVLSSYRQSVSGYYLVAEGGGFRAATVRSVGITLSLLAPKAFPFTIVESVQQVAAKVCFVGCTKPPEQLGRVIAELRAKLDADGPTRVS